jgi:hypothetical protein
MPVPKHSISMLRRRLTALAVLLPLAVIPVHAARGPEPPLRIPLESLGFQPQSIQFLLAGSSMLTLHYVDDQHLLLTFSARHLLRRLVDEPEDDQDRAIDAVLLEIPSGHVLARTTWRTHDHGQYLWPLGHGHFLLRIRDSLSTFAPMANLSTGEPFAETPFLVTVDRRIASIHLTPDADFLTIETIKRTPPKPKPKPNLFGPDPPAQLEEPANVQINFYRLHPSDAAATVRPNDAGAVLARRSGSIAATTAGYLAIVDQGRSHYAFDFHSYSGKVNELAPFDSTCPPAPIFVSHSEFIAFGCRNGHTIQSFGGFNMRGQEMWEQGIFGDFIAPSLVYAPSSGRFAFSRILLRGSALPDQPISSDEVGAQSVVVYQTNSGKQLLHVECTPVERAGQNFTLSPDGLSLALIHADAIEIYRLPPLSDKDQTAVKLAQTSAPAETDLPVHFAEKPTPSSEEADSTVQPEAQPDNNVVTPTAAGNTAPNTTGQTPKRETHNAPTSNDLDGTTTQTTAEPPEHPDQAPPQPSGTAQSSGDADPGVHRKPPTLYTLPGDKPPASPHPNETPQ